MILKKWDKRFFELAQYVAKWSKDPDAKVGAVIVTKKGGAIALGFNGLPIGVEDNAERLKDKKIKLDMIIHAEQNALLIAGRDAEGSDIYVCGKPICARCAGLIIQSGISRVVTIDPNDQKLNKKSKWYKTGMRAIEMFEEANIKIEFMKLRKQLTTDRQ
jgi:dCMP deaminase